MDPDSEFTLSDRVVTLRPWRSADAPAVFAACQDPLIARFIPIPQPYTEADALGFVDAPAVTSMGTRAFHDDGNPEDERPFAIVDAKSGGLLGSLSRHAPSGHRVSFGYWLAPSARGRGVATRALKLVTEWTLANTDLIRLEVYTHLENDASGRVAERVGFVREGIRKAWDLDRDGRPIDVVSYVLVRGVRADARG